MGKKKMEKDIIPEYSFTYGEARLALAYPQTHRYSGARIVEARVRTD